MRRHCRLFSFFGWFSSATLSTCHTAAPPPCLERVERVPKTYHHPSTPLYRLPHTVTPGTHYLLPTCQHLPPPCDVFGTFMHARVPADACPQAHSPLYSPFWMTHATCLLPRSNYHVSLPACSSFSLPPSTIAPRALLCFYQPHLLPVYRFVVILPLITHGALLYARFYGMGLIFLPRTLYRLS